MDSTLSFGGNVQCAMKPGSAVLPCTPCKLPRQQGALRSGNGDGYLHGVALVAHDAQLRGRQPVERRAQRAQQQNALLCSHFGAFGPLAGGPSVPWPGHWSPGLFIATGAIFFVKRRSVSRIFAGSFIATECFSCIGRELEHSCTLHFAAEMAGQEKSGV